MRIIFLGDSGTGKTSIINRFINNKFDENLSSTVGVNFSIKELKIKDGETIALNLIDTAGQEKYKALAKSYFKNADAVIFVFSINDKESFENIKNWINLFKENHSDEVYAPLYIAGAKFDLEKKISNDMINQFKEEYKGFKYYETSAKKNFGIDDLFEGLAIDLYKILVEEGRTKPKNNIKVGKYKKMKKMKEIAFALQNQNLLNIKTKIIINRNLG